MMIVNTAVMTNREFSHVKQHFMSVFLDEKTEMSVFLNYLPICKSQDSMVCLWFYANLIILYFNECTLIGNF